MEITYTRPGERGHSVIDTARVAVLPDGSALVVTANPAVHRPLFEEERAALEAHYGSLWRDAVAGMQALGD